MLDRARDVRIVAARSRGIAGRRHLFMVCLGSVVMLPVCPLPEAVRFALKLGVDSGRPVWLETDTGEFTRLDPDVIAPR